MKKFLILFFIIAYFIIQPVSALEINTPEDLFGDYLEELRNNYKPSKRPYPMRLYIEKNYPDLKVEYVYKGMIIQQTISSAQAIYKTLYINEDLEIKFPFGEYLLKPLICGNDYNAYQPYLTVSKDSRFGLYDIKRDKFTGFNYYHIECGTGRNIVVANENGYKNMQPVKGGYGSILYAGKKFVLYPIVVILCFGANIALIPVSVITGEDVFMRAYYFIDF